MKTCTKCGEEKAVEEFYRNPHTADGYLNQCIPCTLARQREAARAKNPPREATCPECAGRFETRRRMQRFCTPRCRDRYMGRANARRARGNDPSTHACGTCGATGWATDLRAGFCSEPCRRAGHNAYKRAHQKRTGHAAGARYRARKAGAPAVEPGLTWRTVAERDGMRCYYCAVLTVPLAADYRVRPTLDHIVPLVRGGEHTSANAVLACWSCNSSKRDRETPTYQKEPVNP